MRRSGHCLMRPLFISSFISDVDLELKGNGEVYGGMVLLSLCRLVVLRMGPVLLRLVLRGKK